MFSSNFQGMSHTPTHLILIQLKVISHRESRVPCSWRGRGGRWKIYFVNWGIDESEPWWMDGWTSFICLLALESLVGWKGCHLASISACYTELIRFVCFPVLCSLVHPPCGHRYNRSCSFHARSTNCWHLCVFVRKHLPFTLGYSHDRRLCRGKRKYWLSLAHVFSLHLLIGVNEWFDLISIRLL